MYSKGNGNGDDDLELPLFDFTTLANATNGFSKDSKLGEGGFGPVYKVSTMVLHLIKDKSLAHSLNIYNHTGIITLFMSRDIIL